MSKKGTFPGVLLIGTALLFILDEFQLPFSNQLMQWPTVLLIIGLAFLCQGLVSNDNNIFPGSVLILLALHFHALSFIDAWPDYWGMYPLLIGVAFVFTYMKTRKEGLAAGTVFILLGAGAFFADELFRLAGTELAGAFQTFWPFLLLILGMYFIFFHNKKAKSR
ncbi:LiaI-LiaF-like domain-containing protein [Thalassorhabdus alkalitolerans]|uniref:LiaI-LiaF-like domain-containing protein n=1 Tax=Thalassorhabdus alkalitolerans TaxID=2282697 RepID=A0ABW0YJR3_9BACI